MEWFCYAATSIPKQRIADTKKLKWLAELAEQTVYMVLKAI
jgi:hypothetical protein